MFPQSTQALPVIALTLLLLVAGCSGVLLGDPDPEEIGALAEEAYEDIDSYSATVTIYTDGEETTVQEVVEKPHEEKYYAEVVSSEFEESAGTVTVTNGSVTWMYDPEAETAQRMEHPDLDHEIDYAEAVEEMLETSDVSVDGTDTVDDRDTYVVTLVPTNDDVTGEMTYWIDQETYFPVKYEYTYEFDDEETTMVVEYTDLEFDVDPDPDLFEFEPPEGTEIEHVELPEIEQYDTIEAAERAVGFDAPDPDLPGEYAVDHVSVTSEADGEIVTLTTSHVDGDDSLTVSKATDDVAHTPDDAETVSVGGHEGTYSTVGDFATLTWSCDGYQYQVFGEYDADGLVEIAGSIDC